jgi:hypothetical protein
MSWPSMIALHKQTQRDIEAPFQPQIEYGMIKLRPDGWKRIEYGMGHAWLVLRIRNFKIWFRIEK